MTRIRPTRRFSLMLVLGFFLAFVAYDYVTYHSRYKTGVGVAQAHGARVGSLLGWPLGRECRITFDQPIDRQAIAELAVLNSLTSRHWIGVAFIYDMTDADLKHAQDTLPECHVFRVDPRDRQP
tara:strand:- start:227 stop:598 length:372 start_codon:yes stop_codon:yes gene_type:complete